jgi:cyanophycin synthetase
METGQVRCRDVEVIQDEIQAACAAVSRANPGDLVVVCVDQTTRVWAELQALASSPRGAAVEPPSPDVQLSLGDPDLTGFTHT